MERVRHKVIKSILKAHQHVIFVLNMQVNDLVVCSCVGRQLIDAKCTELVTSKNRHQAKRYPKIRESGDTLDSRGYIIDVGMAKCHVKIGRQK